MQDSVLAHVFLLEQRELKSRALERACPPGEFMHALTVLIKTDDEGKLGQTTASVNTEQTASLGFMCDLEFKNADFVFH